MAKVDTNHETKPKGLAAFIESKQAKRDNPYRGVEVKDGKDQSLNISARIAGYRKREIDMLIQSTAGTERGWRTDSDFVRFALRLALEFVAWEKHPNESKLFMTEHNINCHLEEIAYQKQRVLEFVKSFENMHNTVAQLTAQGLLGEAQRAVYLAYERIKLLEPGEIKDHYYRELKARFSGLMSRKKIDIKPSRQHRDEFDEDPFKVAR